MCHSHAINFVGEELGVQPPARGPRAEIARCKNVGTAAMVRVASLLRFVAAIGLVLFGASLSKLSTLALRPTAA